MFFINYFVLFITYVNCVSAESTLCGNWTEFGEQKCIKIIDKEKFVNYENAVEMCAQTEKSHLITINSENEQKFIEKYLFKDQQIVDNVWIGLKNENGFKWSHKSSVDYTNWADKSLLNKTDLNCVQISADLMEGKWVNTHCNKVGVVVCQKTVDIKNIINENKNLKKDNENLKEENKNLRENNNNYKTKLDYCREADPICMNPTLIPRIKQFHSHYNISKPFIDFDNKQKVLFTVWNNTYNYIKITDANSLCESLNSSIIEIRSKEKEEIVNKIIEEWFENFIYFWLNGMRDTSGKWRWNSDGTQFSYTNWRSGHIETYYHTFVGVGYFKSEKYSNWSSFTNSGYNSLICEHELK